MIFLLEINSNHTYISSLTMPQNRFVIHQITSRTLCMTLRNIFCSQGKAEVVYKNHCVPSDPGAFQLRSFFTSADTSSANVLKGFNLNLLALKSFKPINVLKVVNNLSQILLKKIPTFCSAWNFVCTSITFKTPE